MHWRTQKNLCSGKLKLVVSEQGADTTLSIKVNKKIQHPQIKELEGVKIIGLNNVSKRVFCDSRRYQNNKLSIFHTFKYFKILESKFNKINNNNIGFGIINRLKILRKFYIKLIFTKKLKVSLKNYVLDTNKKCVRSTYGYRRTRDQGASEKTKISQKITGFADLNIKLPSIEISKKRESRIYFVGQRTLNLTEYVKIQQLRNNMCKKSSDCQLIPKLGAYNPQTIKIILLNSKKNKILITNPIQFKSKYKKLNFIKYSRKFKKLYKKLMIDCLNLYRKRDAFLKKQDIDLEHNIKLKSTNLLDDSNFK